MKTAVSLPDDLSRAAERQAKRQRKSRSQLYADALAEYLARHAPDEVTEAMNRVVERLGETEDRAVRGSRGAARVRAHRVVEVVRSFLAKRVGRLGPRQLAQTLHGLTSTSGGEAVFGGRANGPPTQIVRSSSVEGRERHCARLRVVCWPSGRFSASYRDD